MEFRALGLLRNKPGGACEWETGRGSARIKGRSIHSLRHSIAVHLLEAGQGIEYVADHLGHKNIQNTPVYAQLTNPARDQQARKLFASQRVV